MAKLSRLLEAFSGFVEFEKASGSAAGAYNPNANIHHEAAVFDGFQGFSSSMS